MGGLGAFYTAMAIGTMSVVAPIAAMGVVRALGHGLARGEDPRSAMQLVGMVVAIGGVVVLSYEEDEKSTRRRPAGR